MILEIKRYTDYAKKMLWRKNKLNFLILYATSKCNLSCGTCFFHQNLNKQSDLSLEEYKKIAASVDPFSILAIGGGEPFLRDELEEICYIFAKSGKIDTLFIPTNGTLTERILFKTENLLKNLPDISISVNPSLDGMSDYHDKNRGVPGTFSECIKTIEKLTELKKRYGNLQVIVNSVINQDNLEEIKNLMEFLKQYDIDFQAFELMRGDYRNKNLNLPNLEQVKKMHEHILINRQWYLNKRKMTLKNKLLAWLEDVAVLGTLKYSQTFKELVLSGKKWPCDCMAGRSIAVINPDGSLSACEILSPLGSLKDHSYNLSNMLQDEKIKCSIKNIRNNGCDCTHICFIHLAIAANPAVSALKIFSSYLKAGKIIKKL